MISFLREAVAERLTSLGIDRRKISQYLGLFFVVLIFALICISMYLKAGFEIAERHDDFCIVRRKL